MSDFWVIQPQNFDRVHIHAASAAGRACRTSVVGLDACTGFREKNDFGKSVVEGLCLTFYTKGRLHLRAGRHQIDVTQGDIVAWNPCDPGEFACSDYVEALSVAFPQAMVQRRLGSVEDICGRKLDATDPRWQTLRDTLVNVPGILNHAPPGAAAAMVESMLELSFHCMVAPTWGYQSAYNDRLFQRINAFLDAQLGPNDATVKTVTQEFGIGPRQVHHIFAARGTTLRRFILEKRLHAVSDALRSHSFTGVSITELADRFGFFDSAHLSRAFKTAYGMSPREYRQHNLPRQPLASLMVELRNC